MNAVTWVLVAILVIETGLFVWVLNVMARILVRADTERTQLIDRIQAPEVAAAGAQVRMAPPREPKPPTHRTLRGRAGVGAVRVPIKQDDEDVG